MRTIKADISNLNIRVLRESETLSKLVTRDYFISTVAMLARFICDSVESQPCFVCNRIAMNIVCKLIADRDIGILETQAITDDVERADQESSMSFEEFLDNIGRSVMEELNKQVQPKKSRKNHKPN